MNGKIKIYAVVGPTASGKSALALELAKRHGGEIISCDSMQIYKRMDIGTAKPTAEEQSEVRHHLIDIVEPDEDFSCEDYVAYADKAIADCVARGKLPIICGGTGLYLDTLLRGGNSAPVADTSVIRAELTARAESEGADAIYAELMRVDRESAENIHPNNLKRVIRALEIYYSCGVPKSELDRASKQIEPRYDASVLMLRYADRDILYRRIEKRVDQMIADGLLEETRALMREGVFEKNGTAAQAIGYKELLGYLRGEQSLEDAIADLKTATRRYAKRQITWFSAKDYVLPIAADGEQGIKRFEEIVNNAQKLFSL
jgi:tRNA dimethylallyltransferase